MGANDAECNGAEPPSEAPQSSQALCVATSLSPESASSDPALLLDALPYVDPLGDAQQEEVSLLLQREMAAIAAENGGAPPDYLKDALPLPQTPQLDSEDSLLGKEFRRKQRGARTSLGFRGSRPPSDATCVPSFAFLFEGEPLDALNFAHVHSFPNPSGGGKSATEVKEWEEALAVSRQLCGHASTAHVNLSLMTSHAPASWQHALKVLGGAAERWVANPHRRRSHCDECLNSRVVCGLRGGVICSERSSA